MNSPWIYHELSISSIMRQKSSIRTSALLEHRAEFAQNSLQIGYNVEKALQELIVINEKDLEVWKTTQHIPEHPLDTLYKLQIEYQVGTLKSINKRRRYGYGK